MRASALTWRARCARCARNPCPSVLVLPLRSLSCSLRGARRRLRPSGLAVRLRGALSLRRAARLVLGLAFRARLARASGAPLGPPSSALRGAPVRAARGRGLLRRPGFSSLCSLRSQNDNDCCPPSAGRSGSLLASLAMLPARPALGGHEPGRQPSAAAQTPTCTRARSRQRQRQRPREEEVIGRPGVALGGGAPGLRPRPLVAAGGFAAWPAQTTRGPGLARAPAPPPPHRPRCGRGSAAFGSLRRRPRRPPPHRPRNLSRRPGVNTTPPAPATAARTSADTAATAALAPARDPPPGSRPHAQRHHPPPAPRSSARPR